MYSKLNKIVNRFKALKTIYFAIDGPAPIAKMKIQKQRREKIIKKRVDNEKSKKTLNKCLLTPGTPMMDKCKQAILYYCCQNLQNTKKFGNIEFIVSGADSAGEGEMKLIHWIHENQKFHHEDDRYLIISSDADLILLGLGTKNENIYILNSTSDLYFFSTNEFISEISNQTSNFDKSLLSDFIFVSYLL